MSLYNRLLLAISFFISGLVILNGCGGGGGGGSSVSTPGVNYESFFYFEGAIPQAHQSVSPAGAPAMRASDFTSGRYSLVATDRYLNNELVAAAISDDKFSLRFAPSDKDSFIMLTVKENSTGRFLYRNLIGRIPKYSEIPPGLKSVSVKNIEINDFSTALALFSAEKNITPPAFIDLSVYRGETAITKNYDEIKNISQSMIVNGSGGLLNVTELAKSARTLIYVLSADTLDASVKNGVLPPPRNFIEASEALRSFVYAAGSAAALAEIKSKGLAESVVINKTAVDSSTAPESIKSIIDGIVPLEKVAAPVLTPAGGTYDRTLEVSISCATGGAKIYYTLDGKTPNSSSALYQSPIEVSGTLKITAMAVKNEMIESDIVSASYTLDIVVPPQTAAAPVFDPPPGTYAPGERIKMSTATAGADIYYTTGSGPPAPETSLLYSDTNPVTLSETAFLKAVAVKQGFINSEITSGTYEIVDVPLKVATPVFSITPGVYNSTREVAITVATPGASIFYTLDGTEPNLNSILYSGPLVAWRAVTIKAFAVKSGYVNSDAVSGTYEIQLSTTAASAPRFNYESGIYDTTLEVLLTCDTPGAEIFYTLDHTVPTLESPKFTGTIEIAITTTIRAVAIASGYANSEVAPAEYTIILHDQASITKPTGLFYYSVDKVIKWKPVTLEGRQIEYAVRIDGSLIPYYVPKPEFSVAMFLTGWRTVQVQAKIAGSSHPLDFGPLSDILRFNIKSVSTLPQVLIIDIFMSSGYISWAPSGEAGDMYSYRIMFDDDIGGIYITKPACYGIPPGMAKGIHKLRVQTVMIDSSDLQITVLDEGPWSAEYNFELEDDNRPYESIPYPENFGYEPLADELKWSLAQPVSNYVYKIYANYSRPGGSVYTKLLDVVSTDSVALSTIKSKLPSDSSNCILEVTAFDGFNQGLKSSPIWLPVGDLPEIAKVGGLKYNPTSKLITWDSVYADDQPCVYRIKIDGEAKYNVLGKNEYNAAAIPSGTHEITIQALLQNYNPELSGPYSDLLEIFIDTNVPQVSGLAYVHSRKIVRWLPVVISDQICYYRVKVDGTERPDLYIKPEFSADYLSQGTHEVAVKAVLANVKPEITGPYSELYVFDTRAGEESSELGKIIQLNFDAYNNIVRWQPVLVEKLPVASYIVELDGVIMTHGDNRNYTQSASYGIDENVSAGAHTLRVKPILANKVPPVEGAFSDVFNFYVQRTDALYKKIKEPASSRFDEDNQTLSWDKALTSLGISSYNVIGYFNTGANVSEQSFPIQETRLNLGVLKFDPRFLSMPSGKYSVEIQGAVIENSKAKSLKTPALILELTDDRKWLNIK